ncbi:unnamed protein product [Plutella xylostella]|uniref:(diamondback moth) hypothetical protein n=1 Tax=Plutella xylostella TaxID=51655 RepID=A0A8S4CXG8_PLUXY|nr:unnamed protein product [Plutella xylostella]
MLLSLSGPLSTVPAVDVVHLLEPWWRGLVLLARLVCCLYRLLLAANAHLVGVPAMMAPRVFQRSKSPRASPGAPPRKLQNGSSSSRQLEPADSSPGDSISDAENFECYGEADAEASANAATESGSHSPGNPTLNRHSWTRTSLRRTPPSHGENLPHRRWGSMRHSGKRQLGSNVLASQLYRSSSFNSSGCGSGGEPADDMYSDVSLEEDVQGLNYKVSV